MIILKTVPEKIREHEVVDKIVCDICGKDINNTFKFGNDSKVRINATIGDSFPECDCRTGYIIDCCPECFLNKIQPLIESTFNIEFREVNMEDNKHEDFYL